MWIKVGHKSLIDLQAPALTQSFYIPSLALLSVVMCARNNFYGSFLRAVSVPMIERAFTPIWSLSST